MSAFEQYYVEVLRFLTRKLRDRDSAQEMTQETFSRALTLPSGGPVQSPRGLLYHIARNLLVDRYRHQQRQSHENLDDIDESCIVAPGGWQPEAQAESSQYAAHLVATIDSLPPRCRQAFVLHRFDGLSQNEVAKQMGISTNMVEKHILRAMTACRECSERWQDSKG
ncbi:RNA polymerase sigma factor [Pseudomonas graminis]